MQPHTRAMIAAAAHAIVTGRKVAGVYDHTRDRHLRIAAECRGNRLQALDGDRGATFGGTLPELYDAADRSFVFLERDGDRVRGYDRASGGFYEGVASDRLVQLYDHGAATWFAYGILVAEGGADA